VVWAVSLPQAARAQGVLETVRKDVRTREQSPAVEDSVESSTPKKNKDSDSFLDDSLTLGGLVLIGFGAVAFVTAPIWGPRTLVDDQGWSGFYPRFPYEDGLEGYLMIDPEVPLEPFGWSARLRTEYIDSFDGLSTVGGYLLLETTSRFGVDAEVNYRMEDLASGGRDELWTGNANLLYRFAQSKHWQFRIGAGTSYVADSAATDWGFNVTYQTDWFPCSPWILSAKADWGRVGHAELIHCRATLGCQFDGVELYTGYDYFEIGSSLLHGPIAGIQIWF
jgi:hypothetical protein